MRIRYLFFALCFHFSCIAQNKPVLQQQQSLSGVSEVVTAPGSNRLLVINNNNYTLLDQQSKIQVGTIFLDLEATSLPGLGKTILLNDSVFLVSTGRHLLSADLLNKKIDTLFNAIKFPEFIIHYMQVPGVSHLFLLATKTYPVDKNGYVSFEKTGPNNQRVFDEGKNCRLILYDSQQKKLIRTIPFRYAITAFAQQGLAGKVIAGSFDGEVLEIDTSLNSRLLFKPFTRAVHSLLSINNYLVAVPHIADKFIGSNGGGTLYVYDTGTKKIQRLNLPKEKPAAMNVASSGPGPSSDIMRIFPAINNSNSILVNYGFSRLLQVNLKTLDTTALPVPAAAASFYCYNRDSTQLIAAKNESPGIFEMQGDILFYDPARKKFLPSFNKPKQQLAYEGIYKLYDREGNYHFVGHISRYSDSLVIYSSNRTEPSFITLPYRDRLINERDTTFAIRRGSTLVYGKLRLERLSQKNYTAIEQSPLFEPLLETQQHNNSDLPYFITGVNEVGNGQYLVTGYNIKNNKSLYRIVLTDTSGKTLFKTKDFEIFISTNIISLSADRRFLAYYYMMNNQTVLEVADLQTGKLIFTHSFLSGKRLYHFAFDIRKPVLWYSEEVPGKKNQFYQVDCSSSPVKSKPAFSDDRFLSFITDMEHDLLAAERYDKIMLARLSDGQILWEELPLTNHFRLSATANGFAFSTEKEMHEVDQQFNHRLFASYTDFKPAEILNKLYYKADKALLDNFGFTYQQKVYPASDFDIYFNRPDIVTRNAGSTNNQYNEMLSKAVAKRVRYQQAKDIGMLLANSPTVSVIDKQLIPDVVQVNEVTVKLNAVAAGDRQLKAIHVVINGIPLFGKAGKVLDGNPAAITKELKIRLQPGVNDIQLFASDEEGLVSQSERLLVTADYTPVNTSNLYFIGIGINRYADSTRNLAWSVKDIRDLAKGLQLKYPDARIDTVFDEQVTKENIISLKKKLLGSNENDKVVIAYSGHGLLDTALNYYLSTYPVSFNEPQQNGLPYEELENLLDSIPARRKLLLIDACHSGEVDKEEGIAMQQMADSMGLSKGIDLGNNAAVSQHVGLKNSFELMQTLFVNVGKSTGATIISAAAGNQFALERGDLKNGVFTYSLLEAMNKYPTIKISELKKIVGERVEQLTNGMQRPTSRNENMAVDWSLW